MTGEQILNAYPSCRTAVAYCELILDGRDEPGENCFDELRKATFLGIEDWLEIIKEALLGETDCKAEQALAEMDMPEFRTYLMAKMGML